MHKQDSSLTHNTSPMVGTHEESPMCAVNSVTRYSNVHLPRLYELAKRRVADRAADVDWRREYPSDRPLLVGGVRNAYSTWSAFSALSPDRQRAVEWHEHAWLLRQCLALEQASSAVAARLANRASTATDKLCATEHLMGRSANVGMLARYIQERLGANHSAHPELEELLTRIVAAQCDDVALLGMKLIVEPFATAIFRLQRHLVADPLLQQIMVFVMHDRTQHADCGSAHLAGVLGGLQPSLLEDRAHFALEACRVIRNRVVPTEVYALFGLDSEEGRSHCLAPIGTDCVRSQLLAPVVERLANAGLITSSVIPAYEQLGLSGFISPRRSQQAYGTDASQPSEDAF